MDILQYHTTILDLLRKERLDTPTHEVIDEFTHLAQLEFYDVEIDKYGKTQKIQDSLAPFKSSPYAFTSDKKGVVQYPSDYGHLISAYTIVYDNTLEMSIRNKIQLVQEDKLTEALTNQVRVVSVNYPIATSNSTSLILFPKVQQSGEIIYFKLPQAPKLAYTVTGRNMAYDKENSVQLLWNDTCAKKVMIITLGYLGLNINEALLIQFDQIKENGNTSLHSRPGIIKNQ